MENNESDGGMDQNGEVAVFLNSYTPEGAVRFALHLRDISKEHNTKLLQQVKQLEAERSELVNIAKIIKTIVDTPKFKNIWPGTSESLKASLKSIKEI